MRTNSVMRAFVSFWPACDGERFARACLAVCKNGAVDAIHEHIDRGVAHALKHLVLLAVSCQNAIENEAVVFALVVDEPAFAAALLSAIRFGVIAAPADTLDDETPTL